MTSAGTGSEFSGLVQARALSFLIGSGSGFVKLDFQGQNSLALHKNQFSVIFKLRALLGLVENWAWDFLDFRLMYCGPSIEPGPTGSGLGLFQL